MLYIVKCKFFCIIASVLGPTNCIYITSPILAALCFNVVSAYWLNAYTVGQHLITVLDLPLILLLILHTCYTYTIQCNGTVALDALFNQLIPAPVKIAVIGSGCSVATEATADISHYYNITHVRFYTHLCRQVEGKPELYRVENQ